MLWDSCNGGLQILTLYYFPNAPTIVAVRYVPFFAPVKIEVQVRKHSDGVPVEQYYRYRYRQSSTAGTYCI
jgi:hypothetical protein